MPNIKLPRKQVEKWSSGRKMLFSEVSDGLVVTDDHVIVTSFEQVEELSRRLSVPVVELACNDASDDLDDGVKICRSSEGYSRTSARNGMDYYTYQHLVTTKAVPGLMALRVAVHCEDESKVSLNGGHDAREIVYVTNGDIRMHWETEKGIRHLDLHEGDSAYLHPGVSHSFMAMSEGAELIAINF